MIGAPTDGGADDSSPDDSFAIRAPDRSPNDEPIAVRVTGVDPHEPVEIDASLVDDDGVEWRSRVTVSADAEGTVDLTERAPESGRYEGVAPMGWLWSMTPDADVRGATLDGPEFAVELRATVGDRRAERTVVRELYDEGVTSRPVEHDGLVGTLHQPPGDGVAPGVVSLHGSGGPRSERTAKLLASHGFATLSLTYAGDGDPIPDGLRGVPLSYFDRAANWLRARPGVADDRVGVFGVSRGGELALVLGARRDWVGAVVSYAGSGVAWDTPAGDPAWLDDGDPVAHLTGTPTPHATMEAGPDEDELAAATVAVEETDGPVLLVSGGDDRVWPARRLSEVAADRLDSREFDHAYAHLTYDDVGHLVSVPYVLLGAFDEGGGSTRETARAGADAWPIVLDYLARGLG